MQCTEFCRRLCNIGAQDGKLPTHDQLIDALGIDSGGYLLGTLEELQPRQHCPFCHLVYTACLETYFESADGAGGGGPCQTESVRVLLFPQEHCLRLSYPSPIGTRISFVMEETDDLSPEQGPYAARLVDSQQISPRLIRSWLQKCEEAHGDACFHIPRGLRDREFKTQPIFEERSSNFRLVDLELRCVRYMSLETRYVTLSYVWGQAPTFRLLKGNFELLQEEGSLDGIMSDLPRTITDAIDLVRSLGERYLWVDTLCLIQDHSRDLKVGIEIMNSVYQGSYFTIVAGSGTDAQAGIPGVRPGSRQISQHISPLNSRMKMAVTHSIDWHLQKTVYNQRGWTFQELVLPRRTLIFINDQVYFRCMEANWSEEAAADLLTHWVDPDDSNISRLPDSDVSNLEAWWAYQKLCENYSSRTLRYDGDALRAFSGVLRPLGAALTSWFADGLPVFYLDVALLFVSSDGTLRRRPGFASYSWAGWSGRITWPRETHEWPGHDSRQAPDNLFCWLQEKTFIKWNVWKRRSGCLEEANCVDKYDDPDRIEAFVDRYSHLLTEEAAKTLRESRGFDLPLAVMSPHGTGWPQPCFREDGGGGGGLYHLDLINGQAEFDKVTSRITNPQVWLILYNWIACRQSKVWNRKGREIDGGPTNCTRDEDEIDFEFRDVAASKIQTVTGDKEDESADGRIVFVKRSIDRMREGNAGAVPEMPTFPLHHLLYIHGLTIRLITGPPPPQQDPIPHGLPPHNYPFQRVRGSPLFSPDGELVGSLHPDDIAAHEPGKEVECLIMSYSHRPIDGSALPLRQEAAEEKEDWNMFWVLHVVEIEGVFLSFILFILFSPHEDSTRPFILTLQPSRALIPSLHISTLALHQTLPPTSLHTDKMCIESITIALCAPQNPPALVFNCGKLHLVAKQRLVCANARGSCVCFFGTCGLVERDASTKGLDFADIAKIRCASCTVREDNVGDRRKGREILESRLLQRPAVDLRDAVACKQHNDTLMELWGGKKGCPFHAESRPVSAHSSVPSTVPAAVPAAPVGPPAEAVAAPAAATEPVAPIAAEPTAQESTVNQPQSEPEPEPEMAPGTTIDPWTGAVVPAESPEQKPDSPKPSFEAEIKDGLKCEVGLKSSRWASNDSPKPPTQQASPPVIHQVPFSFTPDPNNASKVREAMRQIATVKAFLTGRA
ncbi:hypothetical protein ACJ41O_005501 [Fusarium nematophilum]